MEKVTQLILKHFPSTQAIYLFGSHNSPDERDNSDVDIGLLLPPKHSKQVGQIDFSDVIIELEKYYGKNIDLINLRQVSTVLQKEVIMADRRFFCADKNATEEFEMLVISYYQKLNDERKEIIEDAMKTGRFLNV